jgi:F-type H+-transporting ATPase subunit a
MFQVDSAELNIGSDILFSFWGFPITNTFIAGILVTGIILLIAFGAFRKIKAKQFNPSKFQIIMEMIIGALIGFIVTIVGDKKVGYKLAPFIGTLIIYIWISNILPLLIPGISSLEMDGKSLIRTHTNDFSTTFGLAFGIIVIAHALTIKEKGLAVYLNQFIPFLTIIENFKSGIVKGIMSILDIFIGLLNFIGEIGKIASTSLRLFGNMFAGELLMTIFFSLFAFIVPAGWTAMNLFTGTVQALVFGALSASFISAAYKK